MDSDDDLSFEEIHKKYEARVFNLILRQVGDETVARKLTDDTFTIGRKSWPQFRGESQISTWLHTIALILCKNYFKQRDRQREREPIPLDDSIANDSQKAPEKHLTDSEFDALIRQAADALPPEYQKVFLLAQFEGLSYEEIARLTGLSIPAVKARLHRARLRIRQSLESRLESATLPQRSSNPLRLVTDSTLLFIGDSITDCGRGQPMGESTPWNAGGLGNGYVHFLGAHLGAWHADRRIRVLNVGSSGNTSRDLAARWERDVTALAPNWLSVMIGINDVWRQFDSPLNPDAAPDTDEYRSTLDELLARTRPALDGLTLMTPFFIEANRDDPMRRRMDEYGKIVRELAAAHDAVFVDTQAAFDELLGHRHSAAIAWDRIHPGPVGHMTIARAWLSAMECA